MAMIAAWTNFLGANTRVEPRRLLEGLGQAASSIRARHGDLRPILLPTVAFDYGNTAGLGSIASIYRLNRNVIDDAADWLLWAGLDVDVVRSLISADTTYEIFYTGDGAPKRTTSALALPVTAGGAPAASRPLGIPAPSAQFTATVLVAGSGPTETRSYIDTFVTTDGLKEGAPNSTPRTVSVAGGTTMTLGSFAAVPGGYADTTLRRVYVSTSGGEYLLCVEGAAASATLTDSLSRTTVLQSGGSPSKPAWLEPQAGMIGLIGLWNGMVGGFVGKELCICEPFKPWAWPAEYRIPLHDEIVCTGMWGDSWVVVTTSGPYIVRGSSPLNMLPNRLPFDMSSVSKRSVVSLLNGVAWVSYNGICFVGDGHPAALITENVIAPQTWRDNFVVGLSPPITFSLRYEEYALFALESTVFIAIDPYRPENGFISLSIGNAKGGFYDQLSDRLYLASGGLSSGTPRQILRWDAGVTNFAGFTTKVIRHKRPVNPGYLMVAARYADGSSTSVSVYGDGVLRSGPTAMTSERPVSLPGGYKARDFHVVISTDRPVQGVFLADDASDLP